MANILGRQRILVSCAGILAALFLLEIGLRLTGFLYLQSRMSISQVPMERQGRPYVILCLGNSYTVGNGAPAGQSYPNQLQRMFDASVEDRRIVVINGGVGAQTTAHLLSSLRSTIDAIKPKLDLILLQTGQVNWSLFYKYSDYLERESGHRSIFSKFLFRLNDLAHESSAVYKLGWHLCSGIRNKLRNDNDVDQSGGVCREFSIQIANQDPVLFRDKQNMAKAINCFESNISDNPHFPLNYSNIGQIYLQQQNYKEALKWFMKTVEADPSSRINPGYSLIRNIRNIPGKKNVEINIQIDAFITQFKKKDPVNAKNFLLSSDDEIGRWVESDVKEIIRVSRQRGIKIILQDYPMAHPVNRILYKIALETGVPFVNNHDVFKEKMMHGMAKQDLFVPDGHCNANGYGVMALNVYNKIMDDRILVMRICSIQYE